MFRKIFGLICLLTIIFAFSASFTSCDLIKSTPTDTDVTADAPTPPIDTARYLPITSGAEAKITVVSSYSKPREYYNAYEELLGCFNEAGIKFNIAYRASEDRNEPEILIGSGLYAFQEHYIDPHSLGDDGYAIRVVGEKIIIAGGSTESLVRAIKLFQTSVLKLTDPATDIENLAIERSTDIYVRQSYPIKSIKINENDLAGYDIVCDTLNEDQKYCADKLHTVLYDNAGYWLDVKRSSTRPSIRIKISDYAGEDGFRVYVDGTDLIVECAYETLLTTAFDTFLEDHFTTPDESYILFAEGETYSVMISTVFYSDYGAVGDGVTDDFEAIKEAHTAANLHGQRVVAESGKTYYLGQHAESIVIKTDTVWSGATFIIDDSDLLPEALADGYNVFTVKSDSKRYTVTDIGSLTKGQENVGKTFDTPVLLYIYNDNNRQYIRYGTNEDAGAIQQEIILVDENGNVDPMTPIMWDYDTVTAAYAYSVSDKPITLTGGTFITVANAAPREYTYYKRGIGIERSNVTVDGITHTITGEGDTGAPYNGFIAISTCNNVLIKNALLTGHKVYKLLTDENNSMGTYDISISASNNVTFKDCRQTNSITDTAYWGIMGSNYCKNLTYDGCVFSRFDAHKGTHNATIINSEIGHQKLSIIGSGTLYVENTVIQGNNIVNLRSDYGSTWDGDMIFKDVTLNNTGTVTLVNGTWTDHYFGYTCHLPATIVIDGITLKSGTSFYVLPTLKNEINTDTVGGVQNSNKIVLTEKITVRSNPNGYTFYVSTNTVLFADVEVIEE